MQSTEKEKILSGLVGLITQCCFNSQAFILISLSFSAHVTQG